MNTDLNKGFRFLMRFYWLGLVVMVLHASLIAYFGDESLLAGIKVFFKDIVILSPIGLISGFGGLAVALRRPHRAHPEIYYLISWIIFALMGLAAWWFLYTSRPVANLEWLTLVWFIIYYYLVNQINFDFYVNYFYGDGDPRREFDG